ncbi:MULTISPECIES: lipopolysaccharide biosynthesis protein [unclassified Delftia]|uniref:lipopolysaccharide biosynthesis protein n=1 Tax=unclassified Delftia TaxID=2613839 RepID=UPI0018FFCB5A|nr:MULTISPECIES: hypothetical protein [unclassified Delftia]MBK0113839.1 hypothetical protein [Delftia sp. S65]MBK0119703.1 hypothetical protein [Delftia sp. S67]MBK0131087.1 hypothetical protein [Delftia sp. S66]
MKLNDFFLGILRWKPGKLAWHSSVLLAWMLLRAATQAATVFALAHIIGPVDYGKFVSVLAVAGFLLPFVGLGLSNLVLRNGARDYQSLRFYFRYAAYWWLLTLLPLTLLSIIIFEWLVPDGLPTFAAYAAIFIEMCAISLTELCARYKQAVNKIGAYGAINAGLPIIRLMLLYILLVFFEPNVKSVLWLYAASGLLYIFLLKISFKIEIDRKLSQGSEPMPVTGGLPLSLSAFAMRVQGEFNKPVLAHVGFDLVGSYNIAQRTLEIVVIPIQALQESLWPRLYSYSDPLWSLKYFGAGLLLFALLCGGGIWLCAPWLSVVFGGEYEGAIEILRVIAWLPVFQVIRAMMNFCAIHYGITHQIGWSCLAAAFVNVIGVSLLVPLIGVKGAVAMAYISELTMIIWLSFGVWSLMERRRRSYE